MTIPPQVKAGLKRALVMGVAASVPIVIDTARGYAWSPEISIYVALGVRVAESLYDAWRNAAGIIKPADVGAYDPAIIR